MNIRNLHRDGRWHTPFLPCWNPTDGPHPRKRQRTLCFETLLALMMLLMVACTAVQDPSARWEKSGMDPGLEGEWVAVKGKDVKEDDQNALKTIAFTKQKGGYYLFDDAHPIGDNGDSFAARTFITSKQQFMLMVKPEAAQKGFDKVDVKERGGFVWLYEIKEGTLHLSMLDEEVLNKVIHERKIAGTSKEEEEKKHPPAQPGQIQLASNPSIATLDDTTCAALAELAKDKKAWKEIAQFKRVKKEGKEEKSANK